MIRSGFGGARQAADAHLTERAHGGGEYERRRGEKSASNFTSSVCEFRSFSIAGDFRPNGPLPLSLSYFCDRIASAVVAGVVVVVVVTVVVAGDVVAVVVAGAGVVVAVVSVFGWSVFHSFRFAV